jgi:hypothetical protein
LRFDFGRSKPVVVEPSAAQLSSDAGLLPFRQLDEQLSLTAGFAECLSDRSIHDDDLASRPTLSRFENAIGTGCFLKLRDWFIEQFIASFDEPPARLTLDIDPFDDPTHGQQQLTFFHGYYGQYQYLPRVITYAENDLVVDLCLLHGSAYPALGADDDLQYVIGRLREAWANVQIHLRGDSGFGVPRMYRACETLDIDYTLGIGRNPVLGRRIAPLMEEAEQAFEQTGDKQQLFGETEYAAQTWDRPRRVSRDNVVIPKEYCGA